MYLNDNIKKSALPLYEVQELSMEEALLVLAAEKEILEGANLSVTKPLSGGYSEGAAAA